MGGKHKPGYYKKWAANNRGKIRLNSRRYYAKNKDKEQARREVNRRRQKDYDLKRAFGISIQGYERMWDAQHGLCAACHKPETHRSVSGQLRMLNVDHNHQTGGIRKLLCHNCNTALGLLAESPDRCRALAVYIEFHQTDNASHL